MNVVETERLILCPFAVDDVEEYFNIVNDPDIIKYVACASRECVDDLSMLVDAYSKGNLTGDFCFEIREKITNKIIGSIIAISMPSIFACCYLDVRYLIGSEYRNNGYMCEALLGFINYICNTFPSLYRYLMFDINKENLPSQHVVKKCGGEIYCEHLKNAIWHINLN